MSHPTLRAEVRRELERAVDSCESCIGHLVQAAKLCEVAKRVESGFTLQALGELIARTKAMIEEFRESV